MGLGQVLIGIQLAFSNDQTVSGTFTWNRDGGGALVGPAGTAFPASPKAGEWFYRIDQGTLYQRNDANDAWLTIGSGVTEERHKGLRQLIHLADGGGPFEGFATGAYRETTGTAFPTAITWWESASKLAKVVEKLITWSGAFPTTITWKAYDALGLLVTVTDTISYSGAFETSRTRAITPEDTGIPVEPEAVTELPAPAANLRGRFYWLLGAAGEADKLFVCRKLDDDTYTFQVIAFA